MTFNEAKLAIDKILQMGGTVNFPYKKSLSEWYEDDCSISKRDGGGYFSMHFCDISLDEFITLVLTDNNAHWFQSFIHDEIEEELDGDLEDVPEEWAIKQKERYMRYQKENKLDGILSVS